jgi:hypothetical protein
MSWLSDLHQTLQEKLRKPPATACLATGAGVVAADAAPVTQPPEVVDSQTAAQAAITWLRWLKSRRDTLTAIKSQTIALVEAAFSRELELPRQATSIPELQERLEQALLTYAAAHSDRLFADGATLKLSGGAVRRTKDPLRIELEGPPKEVEQFLAETLRLRELLAAAVAERPELAVIAAVTRIRCEPDKLAAAAAFKEGRLTAEQLAAARLRPSPESHSYKVQL